MLAEQIMTNYKVNVINSFLHYIKKVVYVEIFMPEKEKIEKSDKNCAEKKKAINKLKKQVNLITFDILSAKSRRPK